MAWAAGVSSANRKGEGHTGSAMNARFSPDATTVRLDEPAGDGETEPRTGSVSRTGHVTTPEVFEHPPTGLR